MSKKRAHTTREYELEVVNSPPQSIDDEPKAVVHPSKLFGEPGEDVGKWLRGFERVAKDNNWSKRD